MAPKYYKVSQANKESNKTNRQTNKKPKLSPKQRIKITISLYYDCQIYISNPESQCQHGIFLKQDAHILPNNRINLLCPIPRTDSKSRLGLIVSCNKKICDLWLIKKTVAYTILKLIWCWIGPGKIPGVEVSNSVLCFVCHQQEAADHTHFVMFQVAGEERVKGFNWILWRAAEGWM